MGYGCLAWRSERVVVARDAQFGFGCVVPRREIRIGQRPVGADAIAAAQFEVVRQKTKRGAEPMPGGAADLPQIGAAEGIGPVLPDVGVVDGGRALRIGRVGIRRLRHPDGRLPKRSTAAPRSTSGPASTTVTRTPAPARRHAISAPATPAPTIRTSLSSAKGCSSQVGRRGRPAFRSAVAGRRRWIDPGRPPHQGRLVASQSDDPAILNTPVYQASSNRFSSGVPR